MRGDVLPPRLSFLTLWLLLRISLPALLTFVREDANCQVDVGEGMMMGGREDRKRCVSLFYRFACRTWVVKRRPGAVCPLSFSFFFVGEGGSLLHRFGTHALRGRRRHKAASTFLFFVVRRDLCVLFFRFAFLPRAVARFLPLTPAADWQVCETVNTMEKGGGKEQRPTATAAAATLDSQTHTHTVARSGDDGEAGKCK